MSEKELKIEDFIKENPDFAKEFHSRIIRLRHFHIPLDRYVEMSVNKDKKLERYLFDLQGEFNSSFLLDDLYLINIHLQHELKEIEEKQTAGYFDKEKTTKQEAEKILEILSRIQNNDVDLKKITLEFKNSPKKYSFESEESTNLFVEGLYNRFDFFISAKADFDRIKNEVAVENEATYKQGKDKGRIPFIKQFLNTFLEFISEDKSFRSDTTTSNNKMLFIAKFCKETYIINPKNDPAFDDAEASLIKYIREYFRK